MDVLTSVGDAGSGRIEEDGGRRQPTTCSFGFPRAELRRFVSGNEDGWRVCSSTRMAGGCAVYEINKIGGPSCD
jgi:hypothetical protein